jgi:hypothetical protein
MWEGGPLDLPFFTKMERGWPSNPLTPKADASVLRFNVYNVVKTMIKKYPSKLLTYLI